MIDIINQIPKGWSKIAPNEIRVRMIDIINQIPKGWSKIAPDEIRVRMIDIIQSNPEGMVESDFGKYEIISMIKKCSRPPDIKSES